MAASASFIQKIPKVELHIHIEGTIMPHLRFKLAKKHKIQLKWSTPEEMQAYYMNFWKQITILAGTVPSRDDTHGFFELYFGSMDCLRDEEDYYELAVDFYTRSASANLKYIEIFFNPQSATTRGVPIEAVLGAYRRAKKWAEETLKIKSSFIMAVLRTESIESAMEMYEHALANRDLIHGIGLDGDSDYGSLMGFDAIFKRARADGFGTTAHVDSDVPFAHTQLHEAITQLGGCGLHRLDHGTSIAEFSDLLELVKEKDIGITSCPSVYRAIFIGERHKLYMEEQVRKVFDEGIAISIGSDDPPYFGFNWVEDNLLLVANELNHSPQEIVKWQENAIHASWASQEIKMELRKELSDFWEKYQEVRL